MRFFAFIFCIVTIQLRSQISIKGKIVNESTNEGIPFTSIGSVKTSKATLSNENGQFELLLLNFERTDTLKFFAIGYKPLLMAVNDLQLSSQNRIQLKEEALTLDEVEVSAKKLYSKKLGITKYDKRNCSGFIDFENNWKGVETAIRLPNKEHKLLRIKDFSFYIIKNTLKDTLSFRLNIYSSNEYYPTRNILKKPIIFKTSVKQGEVTIDLSEYNISAYDDFYVSLECLMDKVSVNDFCFSGENAEPSYVRESAFKKWKKVRGGGAAFNVTVQYARKE